MKMLRLAEFHDPLVLGFSDKKHYKKPETDFPENCANRFQS
jgi:hypothetical protein